MFGSLFIYSSFSPSRFIACRSCCCCCCYCSRLPTCLPPHLHITRKIECRWTKLRYSLTRKWTTTWLFWMNSNKTPTKTCIIIIKTRTIALLAKWKTTNSISTTIYSITSMTSSIRRMMGLTMALTIQAGIKATRETVMLRISNHPPDRVIKNAKIPRTIIQTLMKVQASPSVCANCRFKRRRKMKSNSRRKESQNKSTKSRNSCTSIIEKTWIQSKIPSQLSQKLNTSMRSYKCLTRYIHHTHTTTSHANPQLVWSSSSMQRNQIRRFFNTFLPLLKNTNK